jgi:hypothetical protein
MPIPQDPENRWWVEVAEANPGWKDAFRNALVAFLAFDKDRIPHLAGTGFVIGAASQALLVISAKHVFTEGVLRAQRPSPGHASSALFVHPYDRLPSLEPERLKVIHLGSATAMMLNVVHLNYNDSLDVATSVLMPQKLESISQRVSIPLDVDQPSLGSLIHMVSLDGLKVDEHTPPQEADGKGQIIAASLRVSIRVGVVTGIYPKGVRHYRWPCLTTSIPAEPGMSGGFVYFPREGVTVAACGIICADNSTDEARHNFLECGESVIALAWSTLALRLPLTLPKQHDEFGHTLYEMIRLGNVQVPLGDLNSIRVIDTGNGNCRIGRML